MGHPLRVLHSVVNMNRGGAEMLIMNLYRNINRSNIQFDFLTCKEGEFDTEIRKLGGTIHRIPYITDIGHTGYIKALNTFFKKHSQYKIVHSHMDRMSGFVLRAANEAGIPVRIAHSHNTKSEGSFAARVYKWYAGRFIQKHATYLMACSKDASKWLFHKKAHSSEILKNGIETDRFTYSAKLNKQVRTELHIGENTFVLGHVGRFNHQKNHSFLIDVFAKFQQEEEDSILVLVGEGPLVNVIERKVKDLQLEDKVLILGPRSDVHCLLQSFDLFLFPSVHEGLPVSLIEAQGNGLTCLISDVISKEVDLGLGLIEYSSLSNKVEWVEKMKSIKQTLKKRKSNEQAIAKQGYDIRKTASYMERFYIMESEMKKIENTDNLYANV